MEYLLLSVITLLISTISGDVEISFMKTVPRLNNSMYCDYYFACHAEGETLQWIINNNNISDYSRQSVGHVFTGSISTCKYTASLLLLKQLSPGQSIFDSVLIVSCQNSIDFDVVCTNGSVYRMTNSSEKTQNTRAENNVTSVNLERVLNENFVAGDIDSCTNIFLCGVNNGFFRWQIQENSFAFGTFNDIGTVRQFLRDTTAIEQQAILIGNEPYDLVVVMIVLGSAEINVTCGYPGGFFRWQIQENSFAFGTFNDIGTVRQFLQDTTAVEQQAILIGNEPYDLVVVMIVIESAEINVTCGYPGNTANLVSIPCPINLGTTGSETSTVGESITSDSAPVRNDTVIIGTVVGVAVAVVLVIIVLIFGCLWIKEKKEKNRLKKRANNSREDDGDMMMKRIDKRNSNTTEDITENQENGDDVQAVHQLNENNAEDVIDDKMYMTPIEVDKFAKKFWNVETSDIEEEFEVLMSVTESSESHDEGDKNQEKNRFNSNYIPYDSSRVRLESVDGSDYINASYINGYRDGRERVYIATQEPKTNTIVDFWRMIYEQGVTTIVRFREKDQLKDEQYWPAKEMPVNQNGTNLQVKHENLKHFIDFDVRTVTIRKYPNAGNEMPLRIQHYFFKSWPDVGIPPYSFPLIQFICHIKSKRVQDDISPIVVHSKAGIGRTGVFIALYAMMEQMKEDKKIGIFAFVKSMRLSRRYIVGFPNQYLFIYKALNELCISGDTLKAVIHFREINEEDITKEFELLSKVGRQPIRSEQSDAFGNLSKNSCISSLPYNDSRVKLESTGNDYISACVVHGYKTKNKYIAAQIPLKETKQDLWNVIWDKGSQTIVLLGPMQERSMRFSKFWPRGSQQYGTVTVELKSKRQIHKHKERIIRISKGNDYQEVTFYHYKNWLEHEQPKNTDGILQLIERLNQQDQSDRKVVMCSDGAGRTGAFIAICEMIEMYREVGYVDFFKLIVLLRINRTDLVRQVEHYKFCHKVLADYIDKKPCAN